MFRDEVSLHLVDDAVSTQQYKAGLRGIHTHAVDYAISNYAVNAVLGTLPSEIATSEMSLPRYARARLSQLCSGYCRLLKLLLKSGSVNTCRMLANQSREPAKIGKAMCDLHISVKYWGCVQYPLSRRRGHLPTWQAGRLQSSGTPRIVLTLPVFVLIRLVRKPVDPPHHC
jgi:hypothetical protein